MSIDLRVRLSRLIDLNELHNSTRGALQKILSVPEVPQLKTDELNNGVRTPITSGLIGKDHGFMIGFEGYEDAVSLIDYDVEKEKAMVTEDAGPRVLISVGWLRSHLEFALAASVAIAIARLGHTVVEDPGTCWTSMLDQPPDSFAETVKVRGTFNSILIAAEAFYNALPVAKDN